MILRYCIRILRWNSCMRLWLRESNFISLKIDRHGPRDNHKEKSNFIKLVFEKLGFSLKYQVTFYWKNDLKSQFVKRAIERRCLKSKGK